VTIRVLVADDQALLRTAFSALIEAEDDLEVVGEAADGREAVDLAAALPSSAPATAPSWSSSPMSRAW
jgi:DNA-binding NarL/FixJ family response regulator